MVEFCLLACFLMSHIFSYSQKETLGPSIADVPGIITPVNCVKNIMRLCVPKHEEGSLCEKKKRLASPVVLRPQSSKKPLPHYISSTNT